MLFIAMRFMLAAAIVAPLAWWESRRQSQSETSSETLPHSQADWQSLVSQRRKHFVILGVVFFLAMASQQLGLLDTSVTSAGFLTTLYVVMVPMLMWLVLRQRQRWVVWVSAVMSLAGVFLLSGGDWSNVTKGDWLVVLCAFWWAVHVVLVDQFARQTTRPIGLATMQFFICGVCGLTAHVVGRLSGIITEPTSISSVIAAMPEILYAGVVAGGVAFTIQILAQRHTRASIAAILMGTESLFSALFGAIFLGDRLSSMGYGGCSLIFAAVLIVQWNPDRTKPNYQGTE